MTDMVAPYFRPADAKTVRWWLDHGVRKPIGKIASLLTFEKEVLEAWAKLSQQGEISGIDQLMAEINARGKRQRSESRLKSGISRLSVALGHSGVIWRERANEMGSRKSRTLIYSLRMPHAA